MESNRIAEELLRLNSDWEITDEGRLRRNFELNDFKACLDFTNKVGKLAEKKDHHPDVCIHDYSDVEITLFTHSENTLTQKDFNLAKEIDQIN